MLNPFFSQAKPILEQLEACGHQAYFVGGCVRDLLLGREIHDIDIATSATPEEVQGIFDKVIPVGIEHGTVIVRHMGDSYEVTTFRRDGNYSDQRHPDEVEFIRSLDEDLQRRDFTINALAMNKEGQVTDLFGGQEDLKNRVIRTVGNGNQRFKEDALRILRALRFSSQLGFSIEPATLDAMKNLKAMIEHLAVERIANEFTKLISAKFVNKGLKYLGELQIYQHLPVFKNYGIYSILPVPMQPMPSFGSFISLCSILLPSLSVQDWCKAWKCSNKDKQEAESLIQAFYYLRDSGLDNWLVYKLPEVHDHAFAALLRNLHFEKQIDVADLRAQREKLQIRSKHELDINGQEIIALFPEKKPGPWLRSLIGELEKAAVLGHVHNKKYDLKEWIKWNPPETD